MTNHSDLTAEEVCDKIGVEGRRNGNYIKIVCYNANFHKNGDRNASLTIYDGDRGYFCYACGESGTHSWLLKQFGIEDRSFDGAYVPKAQFSVHQRKEKAPSPAEKKDYTVYPLDEIHRSLPGLTPDAVEVMEAKHLRWQDLEKVLGWRWYSGNAIPSWSAGVFIPYYYQGKMVSARLRRLDGVPRFQGLTGGESFPYLLDSVHSPHAYICEGESDTATLSLLGFRATGVPGAQSKQVITKVLDTAANTGCHLTVIADNDAAGQSMLEAFRVGAFERRVAIDNFTIPGYKDINEWFVAAGSEVIERALHNHQERSIFAPLPPKLKQGELSI